MRALQFTYILALMILMACHPSDETALEEEPERDTVIVKENIEYLEQELIGEKDAVTFAKHIVKLLKEGHMVALEVGSASSVYFSPYSYVDTAHVQEVQSIRFTQLYTGDEKLIWGVYDGTGDPIKMTFKEYLNRFALDFDPLAEGVQVSKDTIPSSRGNSLNNVREVFPKSTVIEFYKPASDPSGMNWRSLMMVLLEKDGKYRLKALVHSEWTI
ncbi:MAG: hypothetical protein R3277_06855 [Brumimicrobium sp.]|nr:hypothetical protein [Brumimicrobium sp.]